MVNRLTHIFGILLLTIGLARASATDKISELEREIQAQVESGFSGAVLIADGEKILMDRGFGKTADVPMQDLTRFWIASMSKQFTSAAILRCQEQGLLTLDDRIAKHVQEVPEAKREITIRQLLTHQSGLPQSYVGEEVSDRSQAIAKILALTLEHPPGTKFAYSNANYALAAAIVEIVSRRKFEEYVGAELLQRARLHSTGFFATPTAKTVGPPPVPVRLTRRNWTLGSGGMFSTTSDLYSWYTALRAGKVLSQSSVEQIFKPYAKISEGHSGLGWFLSHPAGGTEVIFTRGNDSFGPNGVLYAYPQRGMVIVVLSHAGERNDDLSWARTIQQLIERRLGL